jgi:hypothetical protein
MTGAPDLAGLSDAQLQALHAQTTTASAGPTADPSNPRIFRNQDGSIAYMGAPPSQSGGGGDGPVEINVSATSNPDAIAEYLKAHPDDPANHLRPTAPAPVQASANDPAGGGLSGMSDAQLQALYAGNGGDNSPEARAAATAQAGTASIPSPIRSAVQGMTFNLGDELAGAGAWAGNALGQVVNKFTGHHTDITPGMAYDATVQSERDSQDAFAKAHPWENAGLEAAGSMANPINWASGGLIGGARSLGGTALRSEAVGAGTGALYGAGDGDGIGGRLSGALEGAKTGAMVGGAVPVIGAGIGAVARSTGFLGGSAAANAARESAAAQANLSRMGVTLPNGGQAPMAANINAGRSGADSAVHAVAQGLPVPVPMTVGQMSGDPARQLEENLALRGARGNPAQIIAKGFQQQQQSALRANVDQIGADVGGGFPTAKGQAGPTVSDALNARYDTAKGGVNAAYDAARQAPAPAYLHPHDALSLAENVRSGIADYDPLNIPRVAREVDRIGEQIAPWAKQLPPGIDPSKVSSVSGVSPADVRTLFEGRARLSKLRSSNDPVEVGAAKAAISKFDESINHAMSDDLFSGDPKSVGLWKKAIGLRREFGGVFENNDLIQKLTERQGANAQLKVDAHDASNYIFGRSDLGFLGRQNLYRGLTNLKTVLGPDSDGWNRIRGEAFSRIAKAGEGPMEGGAAQFSGAKFSTAWSKAKAEDPKLMESLFRPEEMLTIDRFAAISNKATKAVVGGDNSSNTAAANKALGALKRLPFVAIESIPFIDHFADKIDNAVRSRAITNATVNAKPRMVRGPASAGMAARLTTPATALVTTYRKSAAKPPS